MRISKVRIFVGLVVVLVVAGGALSFFMASASGMLLPISGLKAITPGATVSGDNPVTVTTLPDRYAYAASLAIPDDIKNPNKALVKIKMRVTTGRMAAGLLTSDASKFIVIQAVESTTNFVTISLTAPVLSDVGSVMITNNQEKDGSRSTAEVSSVEVFRDQ